MATPTGSIRVTQIRSSIGGTHAQRATLRALGLRRIRQEVIKKDRPEIRGMVAAVAHLVSVSPVADGTQNGTHNGIQTGGRNGADDNEDSP